jgi:hypothetical protein
MEACWLRGEGRRGWKRQPFPGYVNAHGVFPLAFNNEHLLVCILIAPSRVIDLPCCLSNGVVTDQHVVHNLVLGQ